MDLRSAHEFRLRFHRWVRLFALSLVLAGCASTSEEPELDNTPNIKALGPETIVLAETAIEEGRYNDAQLILERVFLGDPTNQRARLVLAELNLARGAVEQAAVGFTQLVEVEEHRARAFQGKGIALLLHNGSSDAEESLRQAVDEDPSLWRAWNALAYIHDENGNWEDAIESYDKALEHNPDSEVVLNNRGFSLLLQQRFAEAIEDLSQALMKNPDFEAARLNLRLAIAWSGDYGRATYGSSETEMGRTLNNVGFVALLRGDYEDAEAYFLRAMEADASFNKVAYKNLAFLKSVREIESKPETSE